MFLSKIFFILLALVAAIATTFAVIAPRPFERKLGVLEGQRLDRAQYAAEQMFKVDAHKWIDHVGKLGRDAIIAESLDAASRGSGESPVIHRTIQDRFRTLIPDLASGGIDTLVAVDTKGRVIARVGDNEKEYGDYITGAEIIADALRGYLSDDVWGVGGRLQRLAAAPVLSKNRDRIVGAVYVGAETGPALVERLKKNLDVDVALLLRGKVIASSRGPGDLDALPDLVTHHSKEIETAKRTLPMTMTVHKEDLLVVAAPFPGQAGEQQAYYALIGQHPANSGLSKLFENATSDDLKWGKFPWLPLAGGVFFMIVIGLGLQRLEVDTPLARLRRDVQKLASGDLHKVQDSNYGGKVGGLARDINAALERFTHAPTQRSDIAGKDLNAILGPSGGSTFDLPSADSAFSGGAPAPAFSVILRAACARLLGAAAAELRAAAHAQLPAAAAVQRRVARVRRQRRRRGSGPAAARHHQAVGVGPAAGEPVRRRRDAPGLRAHQQRRRRHPRRSLRSGRGRRGALPPHLRRLHRQEARLRRVDRRPHPRQIPAEAAREQGEPRRQAQLPHRPLQRLRQGRQSSPQSHPDPRVGGQSDRRG